MRSPAKINLGLSVGPPRPDGFHPLATVYQAVALYDDVTATLDVDLAHLDADRYTFHPDLPGLAFMGNGSSPGRGWSDA